MIFSTPIQAEPPNLSLIRKEIKNYYDSGLYHHELERTIKLAEKYINQEYLINKNNKNPQKLAIILDIDETSLSNYEKMVKRDFTGSKEQIHKEILAANSPAIKPMLTLYKNALKRGIKVFFVTGRQESERDATRTNLINAGYTKWSGLYLRPNSYSSPSIIPFKSKTRQMIEKKDTPSLPVLVINAVTSKGDMLKKDLNFQIHFTTCLNQDMTCNWIFFY